MAASHAAAAYRLAATGAAITVASAYLMRIGYRLWTWGNPT